MTDYLSRLNLSVEPILGDLSGSLEERALARFNRREISRQQNMERIVELARLESADKLFDTPVSQGWLTQFFNYAQDISEENAQQFWARILAAYIANPDAVFKRALLDLNCLDSLELEAFIEYCSFSFCLESGWRFVFEESLTRQEIWGYVQGNDYTQHFINIGLLSQDLSFIRPAASKGLRIRYFNQEYALAAPDANEDPRFGYRKFTFIGQQIAKAARPKAYSGYAKNIIKALKAERNVQFDAVD